MAWMAARTRIAIALAAAFGLAYVFTPAVFSLDDAYIVLRSARVTLSGYDVTVDVTTVRWGLPGGGVAPNTAASDVRRKETIRSRVIETRISIEPAAGRGFRGALPTAALSVTVDGTKRIDCPFGGETAFHDMAILVSDGRIHLRGSFKDKPFDEDAPLLEGKQIDSHWLTNSLSRLGLTTTSLS